VCIFFHKPYLKKTEGITSLVETPLKILEKYLGYGAANAFGAS
jgi:hypothetical protein